MKESTENFFSKYETKETLGKGTFSIVKLGINRKTKEKVAIKILEKKKIINKDDLERVEREIEILKNFKNLNIIKINEIFETESNHFFIMEYCENGELFNYIVKNQRLDDKESSYFYYQLINGLEYIHSKNVVHRDLKPENLLLGKGNILKIIDFGLSNYFNGKKLLHTPCGSPCYASPEMVSGKKYNGFNIDIWSSGIILFAMICGFLPFEDKDNDILFKKILKCKIEYPKIISKNAKSLLQKIIVPDPDKRIKIEDIKKEPFYLLGKEVFKDKHPELFVEDNINYNINNNIVSNNIINTITNSNFDNFNIDYDRNVNKNFNTVPVNKSKKNNLIENNNHDIKNNINVNESEFNNIKNNINTLENEKYDIKNKTNTIENVNNYIKNNSNINDFNFENKIINYTIDSNRKESPNKKIKSPDKKENYIHKIENEKDKKQLPFKFLNIEINYKNHEHIMKKVKNSPTKSTKASSNDTLRNNNNKNIYKKNNDKNLLINSKINNNNNTVNNLNNNNINNLNKKQLSTSPHLSTQRKIMELKKNIEELNQKNIKLRNNKNNINKEKEIQNKRVNTVNSTSIKKHNEKKNNNNQILKIQKRQISTEEEILNKEIDSLKKFSMSKNDSQQNKKNTITTININENNDNNDNNNKNDNNINNNNNDNNNNKNTNNDNNNIYYQTTREKNAKSFSNNSRIDNKKIYYTNYTKSYRPNYDYSHLIYKSSNNNAPLSFNNSHTIQTSNDIANYLKYSNNNYDSYKLNFNSQSNFSLSSTNNSIENHHKNVNRFNTSAKLNNLTSNTKITDSYKSKLSHSNNYAYLSSVNSPRNSSSNKHYSTTIDKYLNLNSNNLNIKNVEGTKITNYDYINNKNITKGINTNTNYNYRNNYIKSSPIYLSTDYNYNKNLYNYDLLNKNKDNLSTSLNYLENNRHSDPNTYIRGKINYQKY